MFPTAPGAWHPHWQRPVPGPYLPVDRWVNHHPDGRRIVSNAQRRRLAEWAELGAQREAEAAAEAAAPPQRQEQQEQPEMPMPEPAWGPEAAELLWLEQARRYAGMAAERLQAAQALRRVNQSEPNDGGIDQEVEVDDEHLGGYMPLGGDEPQDWMLQLPVEAAEEPAGEPNYNPAAVQADIEPAFDLKGEVEEEIGDPIVIPGLVEAAGPHLAIHEEIFAEEGEPFDALGEVLQQADREGDDVWLAIAEGADGLLPDLLGE